MSDSTTATPFAFDLSATGLPLKDFEPLERQPGLGGLERIQKAVEAVGTAAYHWIIDSDEIVWSANAAEVLGAALPAIESGKAYAALLDPDNFTSRFDAVMRSAATDDGAGVPYQIEYLFRPHGREGTASIWLEDHGKWFAGKDGRPFEAYGTVRCIDARHERDQQLSFLGNCDPLTGMMNRGRMTEALGEAMTVAERAQGSCAFVIAAINNLAVVNEAYGFEVADEVIVTMGQRLRDVVRTGDAIARYSGSKFGFILNNCGEEDLTIAVERFLGVARESVIETARGPVWALLSIGALVLPQNAPDAGTALARAEEALTEARRLPSDGYVIYRPSAQRGSLRRLNTHSATEIIHCLREDRFRLAYQPVVDAATGTRHFHEGLLRMNDTNGEIIAAAHLIPVAEKLGLVRLIDRAVIQMAAATLDTYPDARLSINISGITATDPRWYPQITEILESNRNLTGRLIVEITETVALGDLTETRKFVERLRDLGCSVAIDDFGAGFTSFRHLRTLPVDMLKLDGAFCQDLAANADNQYFVRSLIDMTHRFGLRTVVEWVETEQDADLLRSWNADFLQGNLFGAASLDAPWQANVPSRFETLQAPDIQPPPVAAPQVLAEPEPTPKQETRQPGVPEHQPEPAMPPNDQLDHDLSGLRKAIAALDAAFKTRSKPPVAPEPSLADLVIDTAQRLAS